MNNSRCKAPPLVFGIVCCLLLGVAFSVAAISRRTETGKAYAADIPMPVTDAVASRATLRAVRTQVTDDLATNGQLVAAGRAQEHQSSHTHREAGWQRLPQSSGQPQVTNAEDFFAPLIRAGLLNVAWSQDLNTGEYQFLAPGFPTSRDVIRTMTGIQPNSAVFMNLAQATRLRISGRAPVTVPTGGRWVVIGAPATLEVVP